jgi:hypothetical protein
MKNGYTHVVLLLDRTGSMDTVKKETIQGFNMFLKDQKKIPGQMTVTLVQFDSQAPYEVLADFVDVSKVSELNEDSYQPRAMTPLLDAIGTGIDTVGAQLSKMHEHERPEKVVFAIMTDGLENASHHFTRQRVFDMIKHQSELYNWKFVFLGANQDAIAEAQSIGIMANSAMTYAHNAQGTKHAFMAFSEGTAAFRCCAASEARGMDYFGDDARQKQASILNKTNGKARTSSTSGQPA